MNNNINMSIPSLNLLKVQKFKEKQEVIHEIIARDQMANRTRPQNQNMKDHFREIFKQKQAKSLAVSSLDNQNYSPKNSQKQMQQAKQQNNTNDQSYENNSSNINYPRYVRKKQAMQELREIQNNRGKSKKLQVNDSIVSQSNVQKFQSKHQRQNSLQNNKQIFLNVKDKCIINPMNDTSYQANHQSTAIHEQEQYSYDETAANSATLMQQQQPSDKLKTHLQDLAKLDADLNRLKNDQQQSKNNFEKMKMLFGKNNQKSRLRQRPLDNHKKARNFDDQLSDEELDEINHSKNNIGKAWKRVLTQGGNHNNRRKIRNNSFDYYNDSKPHSKEDSPHQSYSDSQSHRLINEQNYNNKVNFNEKANIKGKLNLQSNIKEPNSNELSLIQQRLQKECTGNLGIVDPMKAFSILNMIQKEVCPEAYEPEIVLQHKQRMEEKKRVDQYQNDIDKTLFDFDEEIDELSNVSERYKVQGSYIVDNNQFDILNKNQTLDESIQEKNKESLQIIQEPQSRSRSRQKSNNKRKSQLNFTLDEAKQEMIKDLRQKSSMKQLNESIDFKQKTSKTRTNAIKNSSSAQYQNDKLIGSIKEKRNIFNHQPRETGDNQYISSKNRINMIPSNAGQLSTNAFNRYKGAINGNLIEAQKRIASSAYPGERSKKEQTKEIQNTLSMPKDVLFKKTDQSQFIQVKKQAAINPQSLERPAANIVKDIYGKIQETQEQRINRTVLIYDNSNRPLTSNHRLGGNQRPNLFNPAHQKNLIYNPTLQMPSLYNQNQRSHQNASPFQFLNPAFSEIALNQSLLNNSSCYPGIQSQTNNNGNIGSNFISSKNGTFYPGITAKHKHIDRLEKYFCSSNNNNNPLGKSNNPVKTQQSEQNRRHIQQLKLQQQNLIGASINLGEILKIGSQFNTMTNQGTNSQNISSKRRLNQAHELFI
eukprot:403331697